MVFPFRRASAGAIVAVAIAGSALAVAPGFRAESAEDGHAAMHAAQDQGRSGDASAMAHGMAGGHGQHGDMHAMMHEHIGMGAQAGGPTLPGQDAFGAIQEIVQMLEADPKTEWSKVDLEGLRQHLIDMNEVTLKAAAADKAIEGGIQVAVTGTGRTIAAIQRMVPAHAQEIEHTHLNGWNAKTEPLPDGVLLTVTSSDPAQVQRIRALGFIGIMVSGHHHQPHHLAMARGEMVHEAH